MVQLASVGLAQAQLCVDHQISVAISIVFPDSWSYGGEGFLTGCHPQHS